jgi:DNA-binding response OmpR family regulator
MDATSNNGQSAPEPQKILLVEDDNYLADVYVTRFKAEGFEVMRIPDGETAVDTAVQYKPALVLLDIMMPKVSGLDVLIALRKNPETSKLKIIMVSAMGQDIDQQKAKMLGADDYLVKSEVLIADVVERVKRHLEM